MTFGATGRGPSPVVASSPAWSPAAMRSGDESRVWTIEVDLEETRDETQATARIVAGDDGAVGWGRARRRPSDPELPAVGEELAVARALLALAHTLLRRAAVTIERVEGEHIRLP